MRDSAWQGDGVVAKPAIPPIVGKFYPFLFQLEHLSKAGGMSWDMAHARGRSWDGWGSFVRVEGGFKCPMMGKLWALCSNPEHPQKPL